MTAADTERRLRLLALLGAIATLALYVFFYRARGDWDYNFGFGYGRDFVNFWAAGRLAALGDTALLFDTARYNAWLASQLADPITGGMVYSYPPTLIALLIPFGLLPYSLALALWTLVSAAAMALAVRIVAPNLLAQPWLALTAPALGVAALQGHPSGLLALLFVGALTNLHARPVLAGVLLGLLTVKPQLGIVAALIVVMEQRWRVLVVTMATAGSLLALSGLTVGAAGWQAYLAVTVPLHKGFLVDFSGGFTAFLATPYAGLRAFGLSHGGAMSAHVVLAAAIVGLALLVWRTGTDRAVALLIAALASVLATPYANIYDLAIAVPALIAVAVRPHGNLSEGHLLALWLTPVLALPLALVAGPLIGLLLIAIVMIVGVEQTREPRLAQRAAG